MEELDRIFEDTGPLASTDQEERDTGETSRGIGSIDIIRSLEETSWNIYRRVCRRRPDLRLLQLIIKGNRSQT